MKKFGSLAVGAALFIAGYHQTRRQAELVTAKAAPITPAYDITPASSSAKTTPTFAFAFRPIKPS